MGDRWIRAIAVCIVCALGLIMLGFTGHGLAMPDDGSLAAQYRLPDGSYPSLCKTGGETDKRAHDKHHCDLCFNAAGNTFAPPPIFTSVFTTADAGLFPPILPTALTRGALRHGLCRGPPFVA